MPIVNNSVLYTKKIYKCIDLMCVLIIKNKLKGWENILEVTHIYDIDCGDGFMGTDLSLNSLNCMH